MFLQGASLRDRLQNRVPASNAAPRTDSLKEESAFHGLRARLAGSQLESSRQIPPSVSSCTAAAVRPSSASTGAVGPKREGADPEDASRGPKSPPQSSGQQPAPGCARNTDSGKGRTAKIDQEEVRAADKDLYGSRPVHRSLSGAKAWDRRWRALKTTTLPLESSSKSNEDQEAIEKPAGDALLRKDALQATTADR
jgi:hypothetical protein